ncbi:hypothetical protein DKZ23_03970 [Limosilactobacillus reuteri]|uniref:Uncharacterized protein n=1 Tax=Limosilactobacillus reuteri TaxID=1598 RepID=A0A317GHZ5_LIMRT|nr:hypothetical protein DKZ23_03970 [Limosilactobacillus reuteri]PWT52372.1 hypothetical protein DKZ33_03670 [Limosilactobacillus reuteri]PWT63002.1 hypothetical protein DKZ32_03870 [Limosilactobacillus reuteri]
MMVLLELMKAVLTVKKKAMRREIKLLTEENQQLRRYTLLASIGILLNMMIGLVRMVQKN